MKTLDRSYSGAGRYDRSLRLGALNRCSRDGIRRSPAEPARPPLLVAWPLGCGTGIRSRGGIHRFLLPDRLVRRHLDPGAGRASVDRLIGRTRREVAGRRTRDGTGMAGTHTSGRYAESRIASCTAWHGAGAGARVVVVVVALRLGGVLICPRAEIGVRVGVRRRSRDGDGHDH
jgi:hypothetical protein